MTADTVPPSHEVMSPLLGDPVATSTTKPFDVVSENLKALGALSVSDFLNGPRSLDDYWERTSALGANSVAHAPATSSTSTSATNINATTAVASGAKGVKSTTSSHKNPILKLYETSQRVFGSSSNIMFEFIEHQQSAKQCILTINHPNGLSRSFRTEPIYSSKNDAKRAASQLAVDKGAVEFMVSGDTESVQTTKSKLAPLEPNSSTTKDDLVRELTRAVQYPDEIEKCCLEWRAGRVKPYWVMYQDYRDATKFGCALRISLTPNILRTYSVEPTYNSALEAKKACANLAVTEGGVIDFIQHGNGQTEPMKPGDDVGASMPPPPTRRNKFSLQVFYESLPRPFPEDFGDKGASAINAPGWLNSLIQTAQGAGLRTTFYPISDLDSATHGCVLRVESFDDECKTYLVEPCIIKRSDVRAAVCLYAAAQGLGDYIRSIAKIVDARTSPEIRQVAAQVQNIASAECSHRHPGTTLRVSYEYKKLREAFGCDMRVEVCATNPNYENITRTFKGSTRYRNKPDAKIGVCYQSAEQGAVEFMRFRGKDQPPSYTPFIPNSKAYMTWLRSRRWDPERKRKSLPEPRDPSEALSKKRKVYSNSYLDETEGASLKKLRNNALESQKVKRDDNRSVSRHHPPQSSHRSSSSRSGYAGDYERNSSSGPSTIRPSYASPPHPPYSHAPPPVHNPVLIPPPPSSHHIQPPPSAYPPAMIPYPPHPHYYPQPAYAVPYPYPPANHYAVSYPGPPPQPIYHIPSGGYVALPYPAPTPPTVGATVLSPPISGPSIVHHPPSAASISPQSFHDTYDPTSPGY